MTYYHRIIIGSSDCTWVVGGAECTTLAMGRCSSWMVVVLSTSLKGTQTSELEDFRAELQCYNVSTKSFRPARATPAGRPSRPALL